MTNQFTNRKTQRIVVFEPNLMTEEKIKNEDTTEENLPSNEVAFFSADHSVWT